jgi:hypothetical protein
MEGHPAFHSLFDKTAKMCFANQFNLLILLGIVVFDFEAF